VEIDNPSNLPVDLTGWYWCYFPTTRTAWDEPYRKREFPSGATVPPHGFYLVQVSGPLPVNADWSIGYESGQLSNTSGTVAIFSGSPSARTLVDAVGWGKDANLREGSPAPVPKAGQSIVRKLVAEEFAPCQDTDDNGADFVVQAVATPRSSRNAVVVVVAVSPEAADAAFGETIHYTIAITNKGIETAVLSIGAQDGLGWKLSLSADTLTITAGEQVKLGLEVTLPLGIEFVALDLETTSLDPAADEIIEIAWVRFSDGRIVDGFSSLVRPQQPLPARIAELTGIRPEELVLAPPIEEVLPGVLAALSGRAVVSHGTIAGTGMPFDRAFLEAAAVRAGLMFPPVEWVDSLEAAKVAWTGLRSYSLGNLREWLRLPEVPMHRAWPDAVAAGLVWLSDLSTNRITVVVLAEGTASPCAVAATLAQIGE